MTGVLKYWINELHDPLTGERYQHQHDSATRALIYSTNLRLHHGIRTLYRIAVTLKVTK